ncbi:MAG: acyl-CoA reductase [Lachnospiraceae bacterium]|nr:acyl-CoA reductase [Lachnospiraceae bacterium]
MILYKGKVYETSCQRWLLDHLEEDINDTRVNKKLDITKVITAVDALGKKLARGEYDEQIARLDMEGIKEQLDTVIQMVKRENLDYRLSLELPEHQESKDVIKSRVLPLGTLFHIAAGNMDGLPAYSVIEGLLTGNINILKLPQADQGLSIEILQALIETEPSITDFIYVFDTPSSDLEAMKKMASVSDGIVTWGGDEAVSAVRRFAGPGTKLIEWGHRLSFAYLSGWKELAPEIFEREIKGLADHIMSTRQLLCSSCQVIYLDTEDMEQVHEFCRVFLPYLEKAAERFPAASMGMRAEISLRRYCDTLNKIILEEETEESRIYGGKGCSLTACEDKELELSDMFGNCLVKRLPAKEMMTVLRRKKGCLQTAGLICKEQKREELAGLLAACGVVRIMRAGHMSKTFLGEAHDGEYPLRRYVRIVDIETE